MATLPYWNNDEVISSDKLNSMVQAIINGDPLAVKVSNATKNDVNQIVSYLSSLHDNAKTNLNSATSTNDLDSAYTNMTALVSNKLGFYANDDTVDLYSTGIRASIIAFLQAYDTMMSNDRLNNKNTDNTLNGRIDSEANTRKNADNAINTIISNIQSNGGGVNLLRGTRDFSGDWLNLGTYFTKTDGTYNELSVVETSQDWDGISQYYPVKTGETYTFSLYARYTSGTGTSGIYILLNTNPENGYKQANVDSPHSAYSLDANWNKYSITFTATTDGYIKPRMERSNDNTNTLQECGFMLEKGTVAHDWQPAPEDTNTAIENVNTKADANTASISKITSDGGGTNLLRNSTNDNGKFQPNTSKIDNYIIYHASTVYMTQGQQYTVHADASAGLVWSGTHNPNAESNNVVLWLTNEKDVSQIISDANTGTRTTFIWNNPSGTYYLRVNTYRVDNSGYVERVMLEKGVVAHDWSPSPQDAQSQIDNLNANKISSSDINWTNVVANSSNTYNYASGSKITLPNGSGITIYADRIVPHINLPKYFADYASNTDLNVIATSWGECDNLFVPSATMATLTTRPTNPDTNAPLTGDCFFSNHFALSGNTVRAFQKIYSCDYNYVFIRSYNSSSQSWTNWSCLTPYA